MRSYRLTATARADIRDILHYTAGRFGPVQRRRYAELIDKAAMMIAVDPACPGSRARDEVAPGLRSFHLEMAARRRGTAAHVLYYLPQRPDDPGVGVVIVRVLHERMDPVRHLMLKP